MKLTPGTRARNPLHPFGEYFLGGLPVVVEGSAKNGKARVQFHFRGFRFGWRTVDAKRISRDWRHSRRLTKPQAARRLARR